MVKTGSHVGVAFGLVMGEALSPSLRASIILFPLLVKLASKCVLALALAFAAGVMIYVSLIEIFQKANSSFVDAGHDEGLAHLYTVICFFGGIFVMMVRFYEKRISKHFSNAEERIHILQCFSSNVGIEHCRCYDWR